MTPDATRQTTPRSNRAQRAREATRAKLIDAAERVMARKSVDGTTINDITEEADVATGSFYNHFGSKTEIAELVFLRHAEELARINDSIFAGETDPARAISYIQKLFLTRALSDPVWGWFVVHATTDLPQMASAFTLSAASHIAQAKGAGRFDTDSVDAAVRIILLTLTAAMRDLLENKRDASWADDIVQCLLQMLGMAREEARALAVQPLPEHVMALLSHS